MAVTTVRRIQGKAAEALGLPEKPNHRDVIAGETSTGTATEPSPSQTASRPGSRARSLGNISSASSAAMKMSSSLWWGWVLPLIVTMTTGSLGSVASPGQEVESVPQKKEFRVAFLAPMNMSHGISAATSVNAFKVSLFTAETTYLPGYKIRVKWYDSQCVPKAALTSAVDARRDFDPDVIIGPPCSEGMRGVAMLASHWNLPIIGWMSNDHHLQDRHTYSTLIRVLGPLSQFSGTMNYVKAMFGWKRFVLLHDTNEVYRSTHDAITSALGDNAIMPTHAVSEEKTDEDIRNIFTIIKKYARILIFSVPFFSMRKYMLIAHEMNMTKGEYAFICINSDVYTRQRLAEVQSDKVWRRNDSRDAAAREAFEAVIYVMMAQAKDYWDKFENVTSRANDFSYPRWELPQSKGTTVDAYAPFLYDATSLWAILVNLTLNDSMDPRNGSHFLEKVTRVETDGLTGPLRFDSHGDRVVNNWFLDMGEDGAFRICITISNSKTGGQLKEHHQIRWPDGRVGNSFNSSTPDIPVCGFDGELCVPEELPSAPVTEREDPIIIASIGGSVGATVVIVAACIIHVYYRHQRNKQKWAGMMWQVKMAEVDFLSAILCDSIRSSFRNMGRRKSTAAIKKSGKNHNNYHLRNLNFVDPLQEAKAVEESNGTTFGSVCYFKGSIVSVKRVAKVSLTKHLISQFNHLLDLKCQNLTSFLGCIMDNDRYYMLLWEYCPKGSLQDIIFNTNIKLDKLFKFAMCQDVAKGLDYLHKTRQGYHGNLKSTNCVVDSRWTCKLTDFGLPELREVTRAKLAEDGSSSMYEKDLWSAAEVLRGQVLTDHDKRQADVYALGIIMKELFTRTGPYTEFQGVSAKEIIEKVKHPNCGFFRPTIPADLHLESELTSLIYECWSEDPNLRPSPSRVVKTLNRINPNKHNTVIDNMLAMLEKYANHLEELVAERTSELDLEKKKTEKLLYRMLPQTVAEDLKLGKPVKAELFDQVTIYFSDIVGFTKICAQSTPIEVVNLLNSLYTLFDDIITRYDVYKVETIGDAYMLASGLPKRNGDRHISQIADVALDIMDSIDTFIIPHLPDRKLQIRIGIHTGSVVAGVVGLAMPRYCLFGDAVNTASRMESTGLPMKIHMSQQAHDKLVNSAEYHMLPRGEITVKGKGAMFTYFLLGKDGFHKRLPADPDLVDQSSLFEGSRKASCHSLSHEAVSRKDSGESSGQHVRRNPSVSSDTCPIAKRPINKSCVHFTLDSEPEGLNEVDVKSLRKNFESCGSTPVVRVNRSYSATASTTIDLTLRRYSRSNSSGHEGTVPSTPAPAVGPAKPDLSVDTPVGVCSNLSQPPTRDFSSTGLPNVHLSQDVFNKESGVQEGSEDVSKQIPEAVENARPSGRTTGFVLNNYSPEEVKRNNGSLERERQHQLLQLQKRLEDMENGVLNSPAINQLERLFNDPTAENRLGHTFAGKSELLPNLELTSNILHPNDIGHKRSDSDEKVRLAHSIVLGHLYKEPKQANTEHRNSPQNSRPSSPKPDVAIFKEQLNTRLQQRGLELVTPM